MRRPVSSPDPMHCFPEPQSIRLSMCDQVVLSCVICISSIDLAADQERTCAQHVNKIVVVWSECDKMFTTCCCCRYCLNPAVLPSPDGASAAEGEPAPRTPSKEETDQFGMRYNQHLNRWTYPFQFSPVNSRVVRRSAALLGYSPNFKCGT